MMISENVEDCFVKCNMNDIDQSIFIQNEKLEHDMLVNSSTEQKHFKMKIIKISNLTLKIYSYI